MLRQPSSRNRQRGLTLIETLIALVVYLIMLGAVAAALSYGPRETKQAAAAGQLKTLGPAVTAYVKANYAAITAAATASNAVVVPFSTLASGDYLPANFSALNPYGQTYTLYVLQPSGNNLVALVLGAGGTPYTATPQGKKFADVTIPGVAAMAGAAGGFVSTGDLPGYTSGAVRGSYGGWQLSLAGTNIPDPGPGHLAYMQYFNGGTLSNDYLYRDAVPGQPQLNEMSTDLNMGGHNINNAANINAQTFNATGNVVANGDVTAESGNVPLSHAVVYETLASNGTTVPMPTYCPSGSRPEIFITPTFISAGPGGFPISAYQGWATPDGASWIINLRVETQEGWAAPPAPYLVAKVAVKCG